MTLGVFIGLYLGKWLIDSSDDLPLHVIYKKEIDAVLKEHLELINDKETSQDAKNKSIRVVKAIKSKKILRDGDNWLIIMSEEDIDENELVYVE